MEKGGKQQNTFENSRSPSRRVEDSWVGEQQNTCPSFSPPHGCITAVFSPPFTAFPSARARCCRPDLRASAAEETADEATETLKDGAERSRCPGKSGLPGRGRAGGRVLLHLRRRRGAGAPHHPSHLSETVQDMFITPLHQQHASHTLASWAYGPKPHMRS